jgi:maleate cis-trans isomerase
VSRQQADGHGHLQQCIIAGVGRLAHRSKRQCMQSQAMYAAQQMFDHSVSFLCFQCLKGTRVWGQSQWPLAVDNTLICQLHNGGDVLAMSMLCLLAALEISACDCQL